MEGKELNWIFWVLKNKMQMASGLDCFFFNTWEQYFM